ncbi:MAG: hypothetical protein ACJ788_11165 [Ktedonobacteraceae bacterium]
MKKKTLLFSALPSMSLALLVVSLLLPLRANAASRSPHLLHVHGRSNMNQGNGNDNLQYHGGPVMANTARVYAIFWEPPGSVVSSTYNSLILRYFHDIGGSGLYHNNRQYRDASSHRPKKAVLAHSWVDTAAYPSAILLDRDVQREVTHAQQVNGWTSSIDHVFFVFTAKGENICIDSQTCSFQVFCAYHNFFGINTIYAAMPYAGTSLSGCGIPDGTSPNDDIDADSEINITSHEQIEAATDPLLNAWYDAQGAEIGDKCAWTFGDVDSGGSNIQRNDNSYIVQEEWDNKQQGCVLSGP